MELAERGTHADLLDQNGLYTQMWARQSEAIEAERKLREARETDEMGIVVRKRFPLPGDTGTPSGSDS